MATLPKLEKEITTASVVQSQHRPDVSAAALEWMRWRKSSLSSGIGECVVVAEVGGEVVLRNSNRPRAGTLVFSRGGVAAWIAGVKAGEFDDLTA